MLLVVVEQSKQIVNGDFWTDNLKEVETEHR